MHISRVTMTGLLLAALTMTGCTNSVKEENAMLKQDLDGLRSQLADKDRALGDCEAERRSQAQQLAEMRKGMGGGATGFEGIEGVSGSMSAGEVTASVESDLLFDSGKTTLKPAAKKSLDAVAGVLNSTYGSASIRVAGHTDVDPIKRSGFKSNYHLGFERAYAVRDYLMSKGVASNRLSLASYGPDMPKGSKPKDRRVEIVVLLSGGGTATASANARN